FRQLRRRARELATVASVQRRMLGLLWPYRTTVAGGLGITVAATLVGLAQPWPTKILVDDVLGGGHLGGLSHRTALLLAVVATVLLFLLAGTLGLAQTKVLYGLSQRLTRDLRRHLFGHMTRLSLRYHDEA